jgi:hypothetical protein
MAGSGKVVSMDRLKAVVYTAAVVVFALCAYAFLLGNEVFDGRFKKRSDRVVFPGEGDLLRARALLVGSCARCVIAKVDARECSIIYT